MNDNEWMNDNKWMNDNEWVIFYKSSALKDQ